MCLNRVEISSVDVKHAEAVSNDCYIVFGIVEMYEHARIGS